MNKLFISIIVVSIFLFADQHAITDNKIEVILKDDSTWIAVDSISGQISPFATTEDSQIVYLKDDGTWEHMYSDNIDIDTTPEVLFPKEEREPKGPGIEIVPYYKIEVKPQPLNNPIPKYPDEAKKAHIEGTTVVKMLIDIDGTVADIEILKSSGSFLLDQAAVKAALKSKFKPAEHRYNNKRYKVRVWVSRPFKFKLQ